MSYDRKELLSLIGLREWEEDELKFLAQELSGEDQEQAKEDLINALSEKVMAAERLLDAMAMAKGILATGGRD